MQESDGTEAARLLAEAEQVLERPDGSERALSLFERALGTAEATSDEALYARRRLAQLYVEHNPWRAALHLRVVLKAEPDDDGSYATLGLCHALLGNYRSAVAAYSRAVRLAPTTAWYHHNLGHLLDVALDQPADAERHLRRAAALAGDHDEVLASLASCLGRLGHLAEAEQLIHRAIDVAPGKRAHRTTLAWIEGLLGKSKGRARKQPSRPDAVRSRLEECMREVGYSATERAAAARLWADFVADKKPRVVKPAVFAAAVEYAIALVYDKPGMTQAAVARRYGVTPSSLGTRYSEIRSALELLPRDPRYAVRGARK